MNLRKFDRIVLSSSAGKDSQVMMDEIVRLADEQHVSRSKIVVVHADLGRAEWAGVQELVIQQAAHYGLRVEIVRNSKRDLLQQVEERGKWPSNQQRYCTSDHKRAPIRRVYTMLVKELHDGGLQRKARLLNCMGFRAEESPVRAKRPVFELDAGASNKTKRDVFNYLPIHSMLEGEVWDRIRASGVPHHPAYDLGMGRLSCVFCIFAPKAALQIAGRANRELLAEYVRVEEKIGHKFQAKLSLAEVQASLDDDLLLIDGPIGWNL